jgi:hypothetical protein
MSEHKHKQPVRDLRLLLAGSAIGLIAVAWGMLNIDGRAGGLPEDAVARVNERLILQDTYERTLARQQRDSDEPLSEEDRDWVLQRLIEEELLVQRGLEMGMADAEPEVRGTIVQSMVASVTAEADAASPDDETLRQWFGDNADRFTYSSAIAIDAWTSSSQDAANAFAAGLRENAEVAVPEALRPLPGLPTGFMPPTKLRDYLGPGITSALEYLPVGMVTVYVAQGRWLVIRIVDKEESTIADFDSIQTQVLVEYRRALADEQLRDYIDRLRDRADIATAAK